MKKINEILDLIENDRVIDITFYNGNCLALSNFEIVDPSIYNRSDLYVADLIKIIKPDRNIYQIGNKIEFSINEILNITDSKGNLLYKHSD